MTNEANLKITVPSKHFKPAFFNNNRVMREANRKRINLNISRTYEIQTINRYPKLLDTTERVYNVVKY